MPTPVYPANAVTLTFDGAHSGSVYVENGYVFTATYHTTPAPADLYIGTGALIFDYRNVMVEVHRQDGTAFNFFSVDFDGRVPGGGGEGVGLYQTVAVSNNNGGDFAAAFDNSFGFESFSPGSAGPFGTVGGVDDPAYWSDVTSISVTSYSYYGVNGIVMDNFVVSLSPPPSTTFIDFEDASQFITNNPLVAHDEYHQNGFTLKTPSGSGQTETMFDPLGHPTGLADDYIEVFRLALELTKDDGAPFGVSSIDLDGDANDPSDPTSVTFTGTYADGHVDSFTTLLDTANGFQTILLPGSFSGGLVELSFVSVNDALKVDNIRFGAGLLLNGTDASDAIDGVQSGPAHIDGKKGIDVVDFGGATGAVSASLATGVANGGGADLTMVNVENLNGSAFADTLTGNSGANTLNGGGGADIIDGGAGDDVLSGGSGNDKLSAGKGNDNVDGGEGNDILNGREGNDILIGGAGDDQLVGDEGNDRLAGGTGIDKFAGGLGADAFVFGLGDGKDVITDFSHAESDKIDLAAAGLHLSDLTITDSSYGLIIQYDVGGDTITLKGVHTIDASDFIFHP
ncbi:MAG: Hemolysin-type calcium-binding region [Caulobacter sp.]|nr:Hemolysin-type calcium-binding region [Caulobacter sp.]